MSASSPPIPHFKSQSLLGHSENRTLHVSPLSNLGKANLSPICLTLDRAAVQLTLCGNTSSFQVGYIYPKPVSNLPRTLLSPLHLQNWQNYVTPPVAAWPAPVPFPIDADRTIATCLPSYCRHSYSVYHDSTNSRHQKVTVNSLFELYQPAFYLLHDYLTQTTRTTIGILLRISVIDNCGLESKT
ncbi:hypothetical protein BU16DRAFT_313440 [Lophium mytilinum]|uniref:Uncharacterized protein n=1 Tax=Lophium mytilinum TaxID=390894 RepID=A0A6A6QY99_9PEZI|nr:hypothetical protein BU16DRAFT_313440 [Lophium mytilinum]